MAKFDCPSVRDIVAVMEGKNHRVFRNPNGHDLNLVGIRNTDARANQFDDWLTVFYWYDDVWNLFAFPATTDPGRYYREQPLNVKGTAIMKPGQYRRAYMVGKHKGYKAMQQIGPITVYRDNNMDVMKIKELLGHAQVTTTQMYIAVSMRSMIKSINDIRMYR